MSAGYPTDVSNLPDHAFGSRDPMWWGVMGLMAIEATLMALTLTSYFYVRGNYRAWPPFGLGTPATIFATALLAVMIASGVAMVQVQRCARRYALKAAGRWMVWATALSLVAIGLRAFELDGLPFRWTTSAYGSVVWTTLVLHTLHIVAGVVENIMLTVLVYTGPIENKHFVDLDLNALFWLFVVVEWGATYGIIYGEALLGG